MMQRSAAVTIFGILNILFGALGFVSTLFVLLLVPKMLANLDEAHNPALKIMNEHPAYMAFTKGSQALSLIVCPVLIASGIGLLRLKPWARKTTIGYGIYAILLGLAGLVLMMIYLSGPLLETAHQSQGPQAI